MESQSPNLMKFQLHPAEESTQEGAPSAAFNAAHILDVLGATIFKRQLEERIVAEEEAPEDTASNGQGRKRGIDEVESADKEDALFERFLHARRLVQTPSAKVVEFEPVSPPKSNKRMIRINLGHLVRSLSGPLASDSDDEGSEAQQSAATSPVCDADEERDAMDGLVPDAVSEDDSEAA